MKYVIHSTIIFDTQEYTLTSLNDPTTTIRLSNSAGRVLEELIKFRNIEMPVTREHLFSIVWRNHGLEPSNGNLNQQISLIRKTLISLGLHVASIITIPKKGLKLHPQLITKDIKDNIQHLSILKQSTNQHSHLLSPILIHTKSYIRYMMTLTIAIIIILSSGFLYFYSQREYIQLYCCKEINSCNSSRTLHSSPGVENSDHCIPCFEII